MSVISIQNLTRDYGFGKGIFDVSISVDKGKVFGFLGPNGAGKTTTIRHLMGFIKPKAGSCQIDGMDCWRKRDEIQKRLGYIPGEISFFDDMTGKEFLKFISGYRNIKKDNRMQEMIEKFELDPKGKIKKMSKGMKQKLGIAAAFMHDPDILILDEPTSGLDPLMQNRFIELIAEEKKKGKTIFLLMASVGMSAGATSLIGFMISYLYGFIFLIFPMLFCILRGNGLIAKYADKGSMVTLLAAPVKRRTVALTQLLVLVSGILLLIVYSTGLELAIAQAKYPGELVVSELLKLNLALLCLHLFIGSICYLASCVFSDTKYSIAFGAGIPALMYILQMLANTGEKAEMTKYFTFFTLFDANGVVAGENSAIIGAVALGIGAIILYTIGIAAFCKKDLHI